jgi:aminopeptidase N
MTAFLRGWFDRHAFGAATTHDFEAELSRAVGRDLGAIYEGFIHRTGHPELRVDVTAERVRVEQVQAGPPFVFPLDVDLTDEAGRVQRITVEVDGTNVERRIGLARPPRRVVVDPDRYLVGKVVSVTP